MKSELHNLDRIENYLNDLLPKAERAAFEQELANDPALQKELKLVEDMLTGIEHYGDEKLKAQIGTAHQELKTEGFFEKKTAIMRELRPVGRQLWQRWAVAASVLAICGVAVFLWLRPKDPYADIFAQNFQPEEAKIAVVIDDSSAAGLVAPDRAMLKSRVDGLKLYQTKEYAAAAKALSEHRQNYPKDTVAQFYLGLSELQLADFDKAIAYLQPITPEVLNPATRFGQGSQSVDFQDEMTWYLALAYSKRPGPAAKDSTLMLLRRLETRGNETYSAKAGAVLEKLE